MADYPHVALVALGNNALEFGAMHVGAIAHDDDIMPAIEAGAPAAVNMNHVHEGMNPMFFATYMNTRALTFCTCRRCRRGAVL